MSHIQPSLDHLIETAIRNGSIESLCRGQRGATYLLRAVRSNNTKVASVLLKNGVNPNYNRQRPGKEHFQQWRENPRHTDRAIDNGNVEMLKVLLLYGAHVGDCNTKFGTSLNNLLLYGYKSREIKLIICRMLLEHAKKEMPDDKNNNSTSIFLQTTLEQALVLNGKEGCEILLEAGVLPHGTVLLYGAIRKRDVDICQLLLKYGANPFLEEQEEVEPEGMKKGKPKDNKEKCTLTASSPFHAAAFLTDTSFLELFLNHWDCSKRGEDHHVEDEYYYPIEIIYRDPHVSLQAVKLIVAHASQADALIKAHGEYGLFPLLYAAMWDASLDVIFLLLKHWPSALVQLPPLPNDD